MALDISTTLPKPPPGFSDLTTGFQQDGVFHAIGVCVDFLPVTPSRGTDFTTKFTLHDPYWFSGLGVECRFFHKLENRLPHLEHQGDVVILHNIKIKIMGGQRIILSNSVTSWSVISFTSLAASTCPKFSDVQVELSGPESNKAARPCQAEFAYAKAISNLEDSSTWPMPPKSTSLQVNNIKVASGGQASAPTDKFSLIKDLKTGRDGIFVFHDLVGEVRKVHNNDFRVELSVTDYTSNKLLYDYHYGTDEDGYDGDPYGNIPRTQSDWPGPWGKMTLNVVLWDQQAAFARENVQRGTFVALKNVQVTMDHNGNRLEGKCRGNQYGKIYISILKPKDASHDERLRALLERKREYEQKAAAEKVRFVRNAADLKRKEPPQEQGDGQPVVSKKAKRRNKKRMEHGLAKTTSAITNPRTEVRTGAAVVPRLNSSVRCQSFDVPLTSIEKILDSTMLKRITREENSFMLPFQNCRYKSRVRIVDYFPDDVRDFCAPHAISEYEALSDHDSDDDGDSDVFTRHADEIKWEWRFMLLVEDAGPVVPGQRERAKLELLVANEDGDGLLNMEACDLRDESNFQQLYNLKEKLFFLWGNLQEEKEKVTSSGGDLSTKTSSVPFECLIKEYGVPRRKQNGVSGLQVQFDRMFRLFGTSV